MSMQIPNVSFEEAKEKFEERMHELNLKGREKEVEQGATGAGFPYIDLKSFPISPEAIQIVDEKDARRLKVVCFFNAGDEFRLGAIDPAGEEIKILMSSIEEKINAHGKLYGISENSFNHSLEIYKTLPKIRSEKKGIDIKETDLENVGEGMKSFDELQEKIKGVSVTDLVTLIVASAIKAGSSDLHIEAEEGEIIVRFRIDGVLHVVARIPKEDWKKLIARVKLLAGLKLNVTQKPQDGRFTIFIKSGNIDVRVSTIPTASGESVVMRLLRSTSAGLQFEDIGLRGKAFEQLLKEISRPNGMIVTTGPTGSGKTTTLYAILNKLNNPETKIITLEDPIEYKLAGIAQSQVDSSKDYTFASGLRSILRQDPDIVMVGEIRDLETADIAIQAALTGHLVLSTIHTNSASGAIPRFIAIGSKPFLLSPALNAAIGQRLVRKICENCKVEDNIDEEILSKIKQALEPLANNPENKVDFQNMKFYKGKGCEECFNLGYKGRIGIYEVLVMNKEIEEIVLSGKVSEYTMQEIAIKNGMVTMLQDGLLKAIDGITSVSEVFGVAE